MKKLVVVVSLLVLLFVAVSPAYAGGPGGGERNGVGGFVQRSAQGWQTAAWGAGQVVSYYRDNSPRFGDAMNISAAIQGAASRAQGR